MITIKCKLRHAEVRDRELLTFGSAGIPLRFEFSAHWEGLQKTVCFCCGDPSAPTATCCAPLVGNEHCIPAQILRAPGKTVWVGVYGCNTDGSTVVPTVWALLGVCLAAADPECDPENDPTLPVWAQLLQNCGELDELATEDKSSLVAAINEVSGHSGGSGAVVVTLTEADGGYLMDTPYADILAHVHAGHSVELHCTADGTTLVLRFSGYAFGLLVFTTVDGDGAFVGVSLNAEEEVSFLMTDSLADKTYVDDAIAAAIGDAIGGMY